MFIARLLHKLVRICKEPQSRPRRLYPLQPNGDFFETLHRAVIVKGVHVIRPAVVNHLTVSPRLRVEYGPMGDPHGGGEGGESPHRLTAHRGDTVMARL